MAVLGQVHARHGRCVVRAAVQSAAVAAYPRCTGRALLFQLPVSGSGFHAVFHMLAAAIALAVVPLVVPTQRMYEKLGDLGTHLFFAVLLCLQTLLVMPIVRFLLGSVPCDGSAYARLENTACGSGLHIYYAVASVALLVAFIATSSRWRLEMTNEIERAKQYALCSSHKPRPSKLTGSCAAAGVASTGSP